MQNIALLKKDPFTSRLYVRIPEGTTGDTGATGADGSTTTLGLATANLGVETGILDIPSLAFLTTAYIYNNRTPSLVDLNITRHGIQGMDVCQLYTLNGSIGTFGGGLYDSTIVMSDLLAGTNFAADLVDIPDVYDLNGDNIGTVTVYSGDTPRRVILPSTVLGESLNDILGLQGGGFGSIMGHSVLSLNAGLMYVIQVTLMDSTTRNLLAINPKIVSIPSVVGIFGDTNLSTFPSLDLYQNTGDVYEVMGYYPELPINPLAPSQILGIQRVVIGDIGLSFEIHARHSQVVANLTSIGVRTGDGVAAIEFGYDGDIPVDMAIFIVNGITYGMDSIQVRRDADRTYISISGVPLPPDGTLDITFRFNCQGPNRYNITVDPNTETTLDIGDLQSGDPSLFNL